MTRLLNFVMSLLQSVFILLTPRRCYFEMQNLTVFTGDMFLERKSGICEPDGVKVGTQRRGRLEQPVG
jgi:hypothetical protein